MGAQHHKVMQQQREIAAREKEVEDQKRAANQQHCVEIRRQITENAERRAKSKEWRMHETDRYREENIRKKHKLEQIRREKVEELRRSGVPEKYLAELLSMKIKI